MDRSSSTHESSRSSPDCRARSYLEDAEESANAVQKMSDLLKFNSGQCKYLCDKLWVVVQSARSVLMVSRKNKVGTTTSREDDTDFVKIFELLMVLGKQIESFVEGCCKEDWIQAAMVLTNMSEYVSSLGFNLDQCKVAFEKDQAAFQSHTLDEVDGMEKFEAEVVKVKASVDAKLLIEDVVLTLNTLHGVDRDLASYLLQRLLEIKRIPRSGNGSFLNNLFDLVKSEKQVGRGASASVHMATWLGTRVAMKTFKGPENVEFEKEVEILSRLCHPNITSMFCWKKNMRNCFIVMELMDGDLNQLMEERCEDSGDSPPFPILKAVDIMLQIGEGVNYLHNQGIVHRDLKSRNILYKSVKRKNVATGYVHVKVADFGISKARDTNTTYSDLTRNTGTSRWMAPEVIGMSDGNQRGMPKYPFKLDSYSFGLLCYEILVGHEPFWECESVNEVKRRILKKERPPLPCNPSECPVMLKALIEKCWSHEPEERPTFGVICRELKYIKYSSMTGGLMNQNIVASGPARSRSGQLDSSTHSGHSSSRVAENVDNNRLYMRPLTYRLPPPTALAPAHLLLRSNVSSRLREEMADKRKEEERPPPTSPIPADLLVRYNRLREEMDAKLKEEEHPPITAPTPADLLVRSNKLREEMAAKQKEEERPPPTAPSTADLLVRSNRLREEMAAKRKELERRLSNLTT